MVKCKVCGFTNGYNDCVVWNFGMKLCSMCNYRIGSIVEGRNMEKYHPELTKWLEFEGVKKYLI